METTANWLDITNYEMLGSLGEGAYGVVSRARDLMSKEEVAVKRLREADFSVEANREISILNSAKGDNIVRLFGIARDHSILDSTFLIFELCQYDLRQLLRNKNFELTTAVQKSAIAQLLAGIMSLHKAKVIHRDLKPENILVTKDGVLKIADLGMARLLRLPRDRKLELTPNLGTLWYRPPEILLGDQHYRRSVDIWSAGCIMVELWTRTPLFRGSCELELLLAIVETCGSISEARWPGVSELPLFQDMLLPEDQPKVLRKRLLLDIKAQHALKMIENCLCVDPFYRETAATHLENKWLINHRATPWQALGQALMHL